MQASSPRPGAATTLSPRRAQVVLLRQQGKSSAVISREIGLSVRRVNAHLKAAADAGISVEKTKASKPAQGKERHLCTEPRCGGAFPSAAALERHGSAHHGKAEHSPTTGRFKPKHEGGRLVGVITLDGPGGWSAAGEVSDAELGPSIPVGEMNERGQIKTGEATYDLGRHDAIHDYYGPVEVAERARDKALSKGATRATVILEDGRTITGYL